MLIKPSKNTAYRRIEGNYFVINTEDSFLHEFDEVSSFIWALIDKNTTKDKILSEIIDNFDVPVTRAKQDLDNLIDDFKTKGLIEIQ